MEKAEEYAVFKDGSKQYKVTKGDIVDIDLRDVECGQAITFNDVMLFCRKDDVHIGQPVIEGASVTGEVAGPVAGEKVTVFKFKRRKGYHKKIGHRQKYTRVIIKDINLK